MRLRPTRILTSAFLVAIGLANALHAQTTTSGGLTGVVSDQGKAVLPDAVVELRDDGSGITRSTKTDREGLYRFFFLAPAKYTLSVTHEGFKTDQRTVGVLLGPPGTMNIILRIGKTKSEINVTDVASLIQAENGDASSTANQTQISEVPNPGNDLTYIAQTTPGAVMNTDTQGGNFSILGMPGTSYFFTVNGMSDNDNGTNFNLVGSALNLLLGQNQIQEATVVTRGYSGQFGGAAGANIDYITKSGGNRFHGNAVYYWNGQALNANSWILNATGQTQPFDNANQWAASFGGPIHQNKLFFFFDHEGIRVLLPQVQFVVLPSAAFESATINNIDTDPRFGPTSATDAFYKKIFGVYNASPGAGSATPGNFNPQDPTGCTGFAGLGSGIPCAVHYVTSRGLPSAETLTSGRVDWNATRNDHAFLQMQYDHSRGPLLLDPINSVFDEVTEQPWWQGEFMETHTFGSSAASQFLLGGNYTSPIFKLNHVAQALATFPTALSFASNTFTTLADGNVFASPYGISYTQYQISEDIAITRGNHKLGFGARFQRTYWTQLVSPLPAGMLTAQTLDAFYQGGVDPGVLTGMDLNPDFTQLAQSFASENSERLLFYNLALYSQDEWHARPNLSLTVALRGEHASNPLCPRGCFARMHGPFDSVSHDPNQPYDLAILTNQKQAFANIDKILWSPRLAFAWQPFGTSHNTVLRGGVGIFYDPVPGNLATILYLNPPLLNSYTVSQDNLTPDETPSLFKDAKASNDAFNYGFANGQTLAQIQKAVSKSYALGFTPPAITVPEKLTHAPQYQKWSLELEQAFGGSSSMSIGYFAHHGIHELVLNNSANAYCNPAAPMLLNGVSNPCFGFASSLPLTVPDPRFSEVTKIVSPAVSNYNGMVVSFRHRFSRWTQGLFQANYTYGHAFDEVSNGGQFSFTNGSSLSPQDPNNLQGAYGPAEYDVRHSFNANYVWEIPLKAALGGRGPSSLVEGWQVSGTIFARTGFPYTVFDSLESGNLAPNNNYFSAIYAVPVGPMNSGTPCGEGAAIPLAAHPCQPPQVLTGPNNTTAPNRNAHFVQAGCETGFNTGALGPSASCGGSAVAFAQGRNHYRGPGYFSTDFALMKNTKLPGWERGVLEIGFQFFNLLNHPNFGLPDNNISDPGFGQIFYMAQPATTILGAGRGGDASGRMIQLKAQLQF
jgi:hypothetical protein